MGGAEKVLIDIVSALLEADFKVDVLAFSRKGVLECEMQKLCNIFTLFNSRLHFFIFRKLRPYRMYLISNFVTEHGYDFVVGFMEGKSTALLQDIRGDVCKIAWVHNDFEKLDLGLQEREMNNIYSVVDKIVCVSKDAERAFFNSIHGLVFDSQVIYNLVDENNIRTLSLAKEVHNEVFTFLNVGMLRKQKCHDRLIRIAARLKKIGYDFQINIIGGGPLQNYLMNLIDSLQVGDRVFLLGLQENPYPYIAACDCFVLCSDFEGYGIVIKEALFLNRLILTTDVVGPREVLEGGKYGLIVDISEDALFTKMEEILKGKENYRLIRENIKKYRGDNNKIKQQLYNLFL